jgi:hypothetical protein
MAVGYSYDIKIMTLNPRAENAERAVAGLNACWAGIRKR